MLATLHHPKLPAYVDHFEEDGALYLVMALFPGETLAARMKRGRALTNDEARRLLADAADALAYLHGRSPAVVHRDLKPSNVLCLPDGSFGFVDFGAVRDRMNPEGGGTVVGTFGYMPPEQFQGRAAPASDVYSIAATTLAAMTCTEPEKLPHRGLAMDVETALGQNADRAIVRALVSMLARDPDCRVKMVIVPGTPDADSSPREARREARRQRRESEAATRMLRRRARRAEPMPWFVNIMWIGIAAFVWQTWDFFEAHPIPLCALALITFGFVIANVRAAKQRKERARLKREEPRVRVDLLATEDELEETNDESAPHENAARRK